MNEQTNSAFSMLHEFIPDSSRLTKAIASFLCCLVIACSNNAPLSPSNLLLRQGEIADYAFEPFLAGTKNSCRILSTRAVNSLSDFTLTHSIAMCSQDSYAGEIYLDWSKEVDDKSRYDYFPDISKSLISTDSMTRCWNRSFRSENPRKPGVMIDKSCNVLVRYGNWVSEMVVSGDSRSSFKPSLEELVVLTTKRKEILDTVKKQVSMPIVVTTTKRNSVA